MNIIECTIRMKEQAREHYRQLAEKVTGPELHRIFTLLAAAEEEHVHRLLMIKQETEGVSTAMVEAGACRFSPSIAVGNLEQELKDDPDAYRHIIKEEEDTIGFLKYIRSQTDNAEARWLCDMLADKEREHLMTLENIYSFVEEPRTYLEWAEFGNLKGL